MRFIHVIGRRWIVASLGALVVLLCGPARGDFLVTSALTDEIRRYSNNGGMRGAFVPAGSGGLNAPEAMAWGPDGNLYVGSGDPEVVKKFDGKTGAFLADVYSFPTHPHGPIYGLAFTPNGDLLISVKGMVHRANLASGTGVDIQIGYPPGKLLFTPDGGVLVGNGDKAVIKKINLSNNQVTTFASGGGLFGPFGLDYGPDGNIYAVNAYGTGGNPANTGIYRIDPDSGAVLGRWAEARLTGPTDLLFMEGNRLWISGLVSDQLNLLDARTGEFVKNVQGGSFNFDLLHMPEPSALMGVCLFASLTATRRRRVIPC